MRKKRIVLNNIYGVDIDAQAVEVSKLSLLLKVLGDSNKDILEAQQKLFQERALPYLRDNIKCGNSLIDNSMVDSFDIKDIINLNPFNWKKEFKEIFENGGFDVVIGNPPYVKEFTSKESFNGLRDSPYYKGKMDLWYFFGCKAIDLAKNKGLISFIAINNWTTNFGASIFRNKVNAETKFKSFVDFGNYKVFDTASIQTMIYVMEKDSSNNVYHFDYAKLLEDNISIKQFNNFLHNIETAPKSVRFAASFNRLNNKNTYFNFINKNISKILDTLVNKNKIIYLDKSEVSTGIDVHQDFLNKKGAKKINLPVGSGIFVISNDEKDNLKLNENELKLIKPYFTSNELKIFYSNPYNNFWVIYTKSDMNNKIRNYPNIKNHFDKFKQVITSDNKPYGLHRARNEDIFTNEKIIVTIKCLIPTFSYANFDAYVSQTFMIINSKRFNLKYLTGILNSKLIQFWLKYKGKMQGTNYQLDKEPLLKIPIVLSSKESEENLISLVNSILELNEFLSKTNIFSEKKVIENQIEIMNNKLNQLVYEMYDLTDKEITIIENNLN